MNALTEINDRFSSVGMAFPKNVHIVGSLSYLDGTPVDSGFLRFLGWMIAPIAGATSDIRINKPELFTFQDSVLSPTTIVEIGAQPDAGSRVRADREIYINLGMIWAFLSLVRSFSHLVELARKPFSLDELAQLAPPPEMVEEVRALFEGWDASADTNWQALRWKNDHGSKREIPEMVGLMSHLVIGHELHHWFKAHYTRAEWERRFSETSELLERWLAEKQPFVGEKAKDFVRQATSDSQVRKAWIEELQADQAAARFAFECNGAAAWSDAKAWTARCYIGLSFFFSLARFWETFCELRSLPLDYECHPPATLRRSLFVYHLARRYGLTPEECLFRQFGAGTVAAMLLDRAFKQTGLPSGKW